MQVLSQVNEEKKRVTELVVAAKRKEVEAGVQVWHCPLFIVHKVYCLISIVSCGHSVYCP